LVNCELGNNCDTRSQADLYILHGCGYRWVDVIGIGISDPPHPMGAIDDLNLWRGIAFQSGSGGDHHHKPLTHLPLFPSGDGFTSIIF
jgi:hypothetical protein